MHWIISQCALILFWHNTSQTSSDFYEISFIKCIFILSKAFDYHSNLLEESQDAALKSVFVPDSSVVGFDMFSTKCVL